MKDSGRLENETFEYLKHTVSGVMYVKPIARLALFVLSLPG